MSQYETHLLDERLDLLVIAGEMLLKSGAATYRVEETMSRLGASMGLHELQLFVTPTAFTLQSKGPAHSLCRVKRIEQVGVHMARLDALNRLSREASSMSLSADSIAERLEVIRHMPPEYPTWLVILGVSLACGAFAHLLGGQWLESLLAVIGAGGAMLARLWLRRKRLLPFVVTVIGVFVATAISSISCWLLPCQNATIPPIAAVLQFIPGVPLVTTVIDLSTGDMLSGLARGAYAMMTIAGVALGMLLFLAWGGVK